MFRHKSATLLKKKKTVQTTLAYKKKQETLQHVFKHFPQDINPSLFRKAEIADHVKNQSMVYVAPSHICTGRGLFAAHDIPPFTPITGYRGKYIHRKETQNACDTFLFQFHDETHFMDGGSTPNRPWLQEGMAQFANDAIHVSLTGKENNATFQEVTLSNGEKKCFIVSGDKGIQKDEEIYVSYCLPYWMDILRLGSCNTLTPEIVHWIRCHIFIENILKKNYPLANVCLDDYYGFHLLDSDDELKGYACYRAQIQNYPFSSYCLECHCNTKSPFKHIHVYFEKMMIDEEVSDNIRVVLQCGDCDVKWFSAMVSLQDSIIPENDDEKAS